MSSNLPTPLFPTYEDRFHFSSAMTVLLFASYVAALIPAMLTLGRWSDRYGRRPVLLGCLALTGISSAAFIGARGLPWLFAGELIYGSALGSPTRAPRRRCASCTPPVTPKR